MLTERLPWPEVCLAGKDDILEPFVCAIGNSRVYDQNQAGLEPSPEPADTILARHDLAGRVEEALSVLLLLCLLSGGDDGNRDGEELGEGTGRGAEGQLNGSRWMVAGGLVSKVQPTNDRVPVEVGKVCRGHAHQSAPNAGIEASDALGRGDSGDGIPRGCVVRLVGLGLFGIARRLDLDLKLGLDAVFTRYGSARAAQEWEGRAFRLTDPGGIPGSWQRRRRQHRPSLSPKVQLGPASTVHPSR